MTDDEQRLVRALRRLGRRRLGVRLLRWSGPVLLLASLVLLVLFSLRALVLREGGADLLPLPGGEMLAFAGLVLLLPLLLLGLALFLGAPGPPAVARELDRRLRLSDLLAAGLTARGASGVFARETVRRAAARLAAAEPERLYPARPLVRRNIVLLVLALAALYLAGLPPGGGWIPLVRTASRTAPGTGGEPARKGPGARETSPPGGRPDRERKPGGEKPPSGEPTPDRFRLRVVPMKEEYGPLDPVTLFVVGEPAGKMTREHTGPVTLLVDGRPAPAGAALTVRPGKGGLLVVRGRAVKAAAPPPPPARHRVAAEMTEGDRRIRSDAVEIRIQGPPGSGGGRAGAPKPKPRAGGAGEPPPAEVEPRDRFVVPLFRPGASVRKKGYALVPDPRAPPGSAPRRLPLDTAAREAGRRPESRFPLERVAERDRDLVRRYFERLREGR